MNEGISAVCFGWGTARGRAAEGAETVRESAASKRPAARRNHGESVRKIDSCTYCEQSHVDISNTIRVTVTVTDGHFNRKRKFEC